ncbi:hypothetical protein C9374_007473 [Naegleria lovaniensis]|uniref:Uncharacterized protein n=1 Tax=Naegleria lovaniensis TaxID=51637 RepID=A0AA88KLV4_NAELO|nr:uncharacterized protein C9374_007473 [Naegleria lovaniensis]KAG2379334.1 hypothetical protein C9374_007473 [Naegleria lovaniensis]
MDLQDDNDEKTLGDVIMEKDQDEYGDDDEWLEDVSSTFKDGDRNRFMLSLPFIQLLERLMVQQQQHNEFDEYMDGVLDRHYYRCEGSSVHEILNTKSIQKTVLMMRSTLQAHHPIIE